MARLSPSFPCVTSAAPFAQGIDAEPLWQGANEVVTADRTKCRCSDACYPTDWTMPASLGALFAGLAPGARVKVSLTLGDGHSIAPACSINGHECGMLSNVGAPDPVTGLADSAWFGIAPDRGLTISPSRNRISYVAEAGSYRPKACGPGGTPAFPGLPDGICDFSGYEAEFAITRTSASDKDATMTVVPLPAGLPLIGVALILLYTLRRAR